MILPPQIRLYLELGAVAVLLTAFGLYTWHERSVGAQKIEAADIRAKDAAKKQADAETALNLEKAKKADEGADRVQAAVDQYRRDHPEQPIRVCHANNSVGLPRPGGAPTPGVGGPGAGSSTVPEVPGGGQSEGPDIAPELDALVSAASRLAVLYTDLQQRR
jgi:hypothetical protein